MGRELQNIWNVKVKIIPLVVGLLGPIPKQFGNRLKRIGITQEKYKFRRQFYLQQLEYQERFLKSKATGCDSISTVDFRCKIDKNRRLVST